MPSRVFRGCRPICFTIDGLFCLFVDCLVDWLVFETGSSYAALAGLKLLDSQDWLGTHRGKLASDFWMTGLKLCNPMVRITFFFYTNHTQYLVILLKYRFFQWNGLKFNKIIKIWFIKLVKRLHYLRLKLAIIVYYTINKIIKEAHSIHFKEPIAFLQSFNDNVTL